MAYLFIGFAVIALITVSVWLIVREERKIRSGKKSKHKLKDIKRKKRNFGNYPILNSDEDTANTLVTLPDGRKGWTDGLGNGYIR